MADSKNYKVNLVTDVQDLVKGNNELRATSRYIDSVKRAAEQFGRARYQSLIKVNTELKYMERHLGNIYSLAVRVGRLRVTPTVYLIDQATPALERLLKKLKEVSSYAVVARANVHFKMQAIPATATMTSKVDTTTTTTTTIEGLNMDGLIAALNTNTTAVNDLSTKLSSIGTGGTSSAPNKPKGLFEYFTGTFDGLKTFTGGTKALGEMTESGPKFMEALRKPATTKMEKLLKLGQIVKEGSNFGGQLATAASGIPTGIKGMIDNFSGGWSSLFGAGTDASSSVSNPTTSSTQIGGTSGTSSPMNRVIEEGAGSSLLKGSLKSLGKGLGFLSLAGDAYSLATAENNEQRGAALGSSILSTAGAALGTVFGSALPVVGNIALGAGLGVAGDWLGGKMGGMIGKMFDSPVRPMDTTVTKDLANGNQIKVPDFSNVTGFPANPTSKMLAPKPTFADRYVVPIVENTMKPRVNNPAPVVPSAPQAAAIANKPTITTTTKTSVQSTVQLSDGQMSSISGMLKDFKTNVTNSVSVNVPAGAVQVTVKENKIDYDLLANQVGQRIMVEVRKALENRKPTTAQPAS